MSPEENSEDITLVCEIFERSIKLYRKTILPYKIAVAERILDYLSMVLNIFGQKYDDFLVFAFPEVHDARHISSILLMEDGIVVKLRQFLEQQTAQ